MSRSGSPAPQHGPSDVGLAGERTSLAWTRIGLSLVALPTALAAHAAGASLPVSLVSAGVAALVGLWLLVRSLRRPRAQPSMVGRGSVVLDAPRVMLAGVTVVLIGVASLSLVLQGG